MRKLITMMATAGVLGLSAVGAVNAQPIAGYENLYATLITSCSLPNGTVEDCEDAINAYAGALVTTVDEAIANGSFTEARLTVFVANEPDPVFQAEIDALFELLLPDSGAIAGGPSGNFGDRATIGGGGGDSGEGEPVSPN